MATYINNNGESTPCPEIGDISNEWDIYNSNEDLKDNLDYNRNCFHICGPNHYIDTVNGEPICDDTTSCPDQSADDFLEQLDSITHGNQCSRLPREADDLLGRSTTDPPEEPTTYGADVPFWFIQQKSANLARDYLDPSVINWNTDVGQKSAAMCWSQSTRPLTDNEIRRIAGGRRTTNPIAPGTPGATEYDIGDYEYDYPVGYTDMGTLRTDINTGRGSNIPCTPYNIHSWSMTCGGGTNPETHSGGAIEGYADTDVWWDCTPAIDSHLGPNDIIYEEAYSFYLSRQEQLYQREDPTVRDVQSLESLMGTAVHNSRFEECMNSIFYTDILPGGYENEEELMNEIRSIQSLSDLSSIHVNYIKLKLKKIIQTDESDALECMNTLNVGESICDVGVSDKILSSAYLVISIMGMNNIEVSNIERGTIEYMQLTRIINEIGSLLPQAFKKIIDISVYYEEQLCGETTTSTRMLNELYEEMFINSREVTIDINPYFDLNTFIDNDPLYFFQKMFFIFIIAYSVSLVLRALGDYKNLTK